MHKLSTKQSLSPAHKRLLELMQRYSFCRIESLQVRGGEPVFDPPPNVTQDIKIGSENGPRLEIDKGDFILKASVIELFEHLQRIGDGRVALIEVRYGLPFKLAIEQPASPEGA